MRQLDHLAPELAERLYELGEIRDALEPAETAGDLILGVEQLIDHDDVRQQEHLRHRAQEAPGGSHDGAAIGQAVAQGTLAQLLDRRACNAESIGSIDRSIAAI